MHTAFSVASWDKNGSSRIFILSLSFWQACSLNFNKVFIYSFSCQSNFGPKTRIDTIIQQSNDINTWFDQTSKKKKTDKNLIRTCNIIFHNISRSTVHGFSCPKDMKYTPIVREQVQVFLIQGEFWFCYLGINSQVNRICNYWC